MDDSEVDALKRKSAYFLDFTKTAQAEVSTLSRWLSASLLAINGGGALATINAARNLEGLRTVGLLFFSGLAMALFSGWFNQWITQKFIPSATNLADYYAEAAFLCRRNIEYETEANAKVVTLGKLAWIGPVAGWLSFLSFAGAAYLMADAIDVSRKHNSAVCNALRQDLLSKSASHLESRERYVALNCAS